MFWSDEFALFDGLKDTSFVFAGLKLLVSLVFLGLFKEENSIGLDKEVHEFSFFFQEQVAVLVFEHDHFLYFLLIVINRVISSGSVDNHENTFLDVIESFEGFMKVSDEFGEFVCSGFTDMGLVNNQN